MKSIWSFLIISAIVTGFLPVVRFRNTAFFIFFLTCALIDPIISCITFIFNVRSYWFYPFIGVVMLLALPTKSKKNIFISLVSAIILIPVFKEQSWIPLLISIVNLCFIIFYLLEKITDEYKHAASISIFLPILVCSTSIDTIKVYLYYRHIDLFIQSYTWFLIIGLLSPFILYYFGFDKKYIFKRSTVGSFDQEIANKESEITKINPLNDSELISNLNRREIEIFALLAAGQKQNEIAKQLYIERKTVYFHVRNIKDKLNTNSTQDLYKLAYKFKGSYDDKFLISHGDGRQKYN
jgi:DNA-binding CsgD family transcriptional regulator